MIRGRNWTRNLALWFAPTILLTLGAAGCDDKASAGDPCAAEDCSGHGACEVTDGSALCNCNIGYDGTNCDECADGYLIDANGACIQSESCAADDPCGDNGTCDDSTGYVVCECDPGYTGDFCQQCYPGYHDDGSAACVLDIECMPNSCAGHGTCDDTSGLVECSCDAGYVGDHCETCDADYHRDENDNCVADSDCTTNDPCGANGTCDDTTGVIECICDPGWNGDFCQQCYPGYHDDGSGACVLDELCMPNTCDSHGTCDATGGTVDCDCDVGYIDDNCETCDATYHRDENENCELNEDCSATDPCGAHGTCVDTTGLTECVCDIGYDGQFCASCYAGYHDDGNGVCVLDEQCLASSCSGYGTCTDTGGVVSCGCDTGYSGPWCENCDVDYHRDTNQICVADEDCTVTDPCGANGTCVDTTGVIECACDVGYNGQFCGSCYAGYHDDGNGVCVLDEQCLASSCSGHGTCTDTGGVVNCGCNAGYVGANCENCDVDYHRDANQNCVADEDCGATDPCGANGTCVDTTGLIECVCDTGYDGQFCGTCYAGYHDDGSGNCVLDEQCLSGSCSGTTAGSCGDTGGVVICVCNAGYTGSNCETCDADYHRDGNNDCVADDDCTAGDPCVNGTCVDTTGVIVCVCDAGYDGMYCDTCYAGYHDDGTGVCVLDEQCLPNTCSDHGTCTAPGGVVGCSCDAGYVGASCQNCDVDYHRDAANDCVPDEDCSMSNPCVNGTCDDTTGVIECVCDIGYTGAICDTCYPGYEVNTISGLCEIPCPSMQEYRCNGQCTYAGDSQNCGSCGNDCLDLMCLSTGGMNDFECGCYTGWPYELCSPTQCINKETDPQNCGACGITCDTAAGESCFLGECVVEDTGCWCDNDPNVLCCAGNCYFGWDLRYDNNMCGDCTTQCTPGVELCVLGDCMAGDGSCGGMCDPNSQLCCQGNCRQQWDFEHDSQNCGTCGNDCGANAYCSDGRCGCQQGYADCGAGCIDVRADNNNCGSCGNVCGAGEACVFGSCVPDNPTGCGGTCGGDEFCCTLTEWPWEECVNIPNMDNNTDHCGGCDPCAPGESCNGGNCHCPYMIYGYCNGECTDFEDNNNCGDCGVVCGQNEQCQFNGMTTECVCTGMECGGVCTDIWFDEANCGNCGTPCGAGEACVSGQCYLENGTGCDPSCADQGACCDVGGVGQCFSSWQFQSDPTNCGGCGIICGGGEVCNSGICGPPPGDDCSTPQPLSEMGGQTNLLCQNSPSGFMSANCMPAADGSQFDRFHVFTIPWDNPGGWQIDFWSFGLGGNVMAEVWAAPVPGTWCDNTAMPVGCLGPWTSIWIDPMMFPVGTEIIVMVYSLDDPCMMGQGEYELMVMPN